MNDRSGIFRKEVCAVEGTVLFGKYKICRVIGRGRSSTVYLAEHLGLEEYRAIKRVPKGDGERLYEASVLKNLKHPGIPVIYDLEEDSNYYYLIEEYLDGESLYACLEREGSLTKARRISYGIQLCQIIFYLHSFETYPILYLDLQPHNLLICQGTLKLIDFDQAVSANAAKRLRKRCGTRGFAAPEQYTDEPLDVRTDIYAIGALLFYMGTGHAPGEAAGAGKSCGSMAGRTSAGRDGLDAVTERCLRQNREERFQSVREVQEALSELRAGAFSENQIPLLKAAVVSSSHGMGVTHVSFCAASYLLSQGYLCLIRERNDSGAVLKMAASRNLLPDDYGIYHMDEWLVQPEYGPNVRLEKPQADAVIEDLGTGLQTVLDEDYDLILLLCGAKDWELEDTISSVRVLAQKKNLRVIFNHVSPDDILILPGDITKFQLFRLPELSLGGRLSVHDSFWEAVLLGTDAWEKLLKRKKGEERMAERRPLVWRLCRKAAQGLQRWKKRVFRQRQ
ncbi:MAG: serine/threonine protein kinase [Clostridium sp.]|nr:serine/threonine protein kinase [Clostridium sp.]